VDTNPEQYTSTELALDNLQYKAPSPRSHDENGHLDTGLLQGVASQDRELRKSLIMPNGIIADEIFETWGLTCGPYQLLKWI